MTTLDLKDAYLSVSVCLHQTFKTRSSIPSQTGCSYDPISGRLSNIGFNLPGGTESHSYGCIPPGKPRLHCQSGKVMFDSDPNNNIPGLCNQLHCRSTKPPTGESCKGDLPLPEGKGNSNYACSSNSKCTRHSRVVSPSNLASSPSFSTLANQNDLSSTCEQPELRCDYYPGSRLFGRTSLELWQWCLERNIMISAQHVPGKLNTIADLESRVFNDSSEWKIAPQIISPFLKGCEIDLFASRLSAQLPQYVSWRPDPEAVHADALTMDWAPFKGYAFPPFNLIPAVLNKVSQDKADIILVAPIWAAQSWWPLLLNLLIEQPVLLPSSRHLLRDPADPQRIYPMFLRLHLAVFHVSGDSTKQWEFQTMLRKFSFRHPANLQGKRINQLGDAGMAGVLRERLILFQHL